MTLLRSIITVLFLSVAIASPVEQKTGRGVATVSVNELFERATCSVSAGSGTCGSVSGGGCPGGKFYAGTGPNWPCPGSDDIQCCVKSSGGGQSCSVNAGSGTCGSVSGGGCPGGKFYAGTGPNWPCPGSDDIQCCVGGDLALRILNKAKEAAGTPYAWGGGSCTGPTHDQPPWEYGDIGFDCSGLVAWAICKVTGRDLFSEGLRVTHSMYCASFSKLKYQKYPYSQRKLGDAVFFGGACDCSNPETIHHVGLMMDSGDRLWNAPNDQINKVLESSIRGFHETPCPYVIRFG